ncbi:MAG TPA: pyruvate dehydrogenase (acetyl-transferring) E1 component subunit alpha [Anaerolineales bacterium]|nr:pyruvate dehydrogenase (acetyl-transferring) E1 component subunit alpha [Anaerolineales bacterium]
MDQAEMLRLYKQMVVIRLLEEKCEELYQKGKIGGFMHLYIGQEATGVGAVSARLPQDNVITAYRDHGLAVACGMSPRVIIAEMLGKATGCCKGKGGSMHLADVNLKFWGGHAIVGAHIALATGLAWADKYRGSDAVTLCFFGEGATNIGYFHEGLNLAAVWKLPCVFICENNSYGMWTPVANASAVTEIRRKAVAYGMPSDQADGMDLLAVRAAAEKAIAHVRSGQGPYFLEIITYRYRGHSMGDQRPYRTQEEIRRWQTNDPIGKFEKVLLESGVAQAEIDRLEAQAEADIADAVQFAEASPFPALDDIWTDIYVEN